MNSGGAPPTSLHSLATPSALATDAAPQTSVPPRARITAQPSRVVKCYLSILVPAYNEENRLPATLETIATYLQKRDFSHELIVVDDGSRDATREVVREFAAAHSWVRLVQYDDENGAALNRGKGFAIRAGVEAAVGRDILFSDADLSTPIEEMERLLPPISRGDCDIAIASRALPESNLAVHQPVHREFMGRTFNKIVQKMAVPGIMDTQCGFKAFRGDVAKRLFALAQIDGFGFDPEILFLARKFGFKIQELPVTWCHRDDSRVNPLSAPFSMLRELCEIRWNDARGLYDEEI
ncbi:MAG: glycosyltransferase family 2 protein [Armatimonadetes bacterium]|nr:glycosyltransferase family 2 protein [Armatimonadota bacterium]